MIESGLRGRIRKALREEFPRAMIVGQPASALGGSGRSDLYVVESGCYVALEVKTATGRATLAQIQWLQRVRRSGGWGWVVRSPQHARAAVRWAVQGGPRMTDIDFDTLFRNDPAPTSDVVLPVPAEGEIRAFLTPESNGSQPPEDETPRDEPEVSLVSIYEKLDECIREIKTLYELMATHVRQHVNEFTPIPKEKTSPVSASDLLAEAPTPRTSRSRKR